MWLHERATLDALASNSLRDRERRGRLGGVGRGSSRRGELGGFAGADRDGRRADEHRVAARLLRFSSRWFFPFTTYAPRASNADTPSFVPCRRSRDRSSDPTPLTRRASLRAEFSHLYASVAAGSRDASGARRGGEDRPSNDANAENDANDANADANAASRVDAYDEYFAVKNEPLVTVLGVSDVSATARATPSSAR